MQTKFSIFNYWNSVIILRDKRHQPSFKLHSDISNVDMSLSWIHTNVYFGIVWQWYWIGYIVLRHCKDLALKLN